MSTQPSDVAAEKVLLGCLMMGGTADGVAPADFYRPAHQLIYEAIGALRADGNTAEPVAVADELRRRGQLSKIRGADYLHTCLAAAPSAAQTGHYAGIVRELAERRQLVEHAERLHQAASNPASDLGAVRALVPAPRSDSVSETVSEDGWALSRQYDTSDTSDSTSEDAKMLAGSHDGAWLTGQDFPPLAYAIDGLIPEGLTILVGPPKAGKSWLTLGLLLAVASGGVALGHIKAAPARRVFYLALEDGDRRMQDRCRTLLAPDQDIPALFHYQTRIMPGMVLPTIQAWMRRYPDTAMVVVDTLGKVMPPSLQGESAYQRDYRVGAALKAQADAYSGLGVMVLHHDRKAGAEDFVDSVSGTHGLAGAADTIVVLCRKRQSPEGLMQITGRDVPENEYALKVTDGTAWQLDGADLGAAAAKARKRETDRALGETSAQVLTSVREHPEGIRGGDLVPEFGKDVYQVLKRLAEAGRIDKVERGLYVPLSEVSEVSDSQVRDVGTVSDTLSEVSDWPPGSYGESA